MTTQANIPNKWYVPFANGDSSRVEIPVTTSDPTRASQTLGFPPLTMQPPESGGVPPQGEDFNGGMNQIARVCWWVLNGGGWPYDSTFANNANINGYPNGATLQAADFRGDWINTADGNTNNPDTNGTNWVPGFQYGVTALTSLTGGTVTPTPAQAAKGTITLSGTLTSALTVILPTWLKNWSITNNTTGAFVTIVKTAAGSGVTIPQNGAPTRVSGDGTNITQVAENIATATTPTQAARFDQTQGRLLNVQIFNSTGTYTPTAGTTSVVVEAVGGGGGGGGAFAVTASQTSSAAPGSAGAYGIGRYTSAFSGVTVTVGNGGTGGTGAAGTAGTNSSFGALLTATGGAAGGSNAATTATASLASGSATTAGTGGYLNSAGSCGQITVILGINAFLALGGAGGNSRFGAGGGTASGNTNGQNGLAPGSGGAGTANANNSGALTGGNGAKGIVIVYEYA